MALRSLLRAASWLGFVLFLVALVPGLWVFAGEPGWPGYFPALRLHVLAGTALVFVGVPATLAHLWLTGSRPLLALLAPSAALGGAWFVLDRLAGLNWLQDGYHYPWISSGVAAGAAAAALLAVALLVQVLPRLTRAVPTRWSGIGLAVAAGAAVALGLAGDRIRGDARWGALVSHSAVGWACLWLTLLHLNAVRDKLEARGRPAAIAALLAFVAVASVAWVGWFDRKYTSGFEERGAEARWTTTTLPASAEERAALDAVFPPDQLGRSASCGTAGCHEALTEQWSASAHRFAADNALYRAAVAALVDAKGPAEATFCANCHDPERVLGGTVLTDYATGAPPPGDGVSCIACHAAYDAPHPPKNGVARFRAPRPYPGATEQQRNANLLADPRLHRQSMQANRHLMSDEGCGVCHRLELGDHYGVADLIVQAPYEPDAPFSVSCNLCHMPVRTPMPGGRMPLYDHRWPGLNVDLPDYVTHPAANASALAAQVAAVERFGEGSLATDHLPDGPTENPEFARYRAKATGSGLLLVEAAAERTESGVVLTVTTTNHRAGHPFPAGPLDLQEVWLEVLAQDPTTGATLAHVGALTDDGRVPPDAPRLGARELDADGQPIAQHRIDRIATLADKRLALPGEPLSDVLTLDLPPGPALIAVAWRFRRVNPDFAAFAGLEPFPVHVLGSTTTSP